MRLFEELIGELREQVAAMRGRGARVREHAAAGQAPWPEGRRGGIVLEHETAVELGHPRDESVAFLVWTEDMSRVADGRVTLVGRDLGEAAVRSLPFGKAVVLGVTGFTEDNCHVRQRRMERLRYEVLLAGYMMRAASQRGREWSRVSRAAVAGGLTLPRLGAALLAAYHGLPYVEAAEIVLVTSSAEDVRALAPLYERAERIFGAMNRIARERFHECSACEYTDVCNEVDTLRALRRALAAEGRLG